MGDLALIGAADDARLWMHVTAFIAEKKSQKTYIAAFKEFCDWAKIVIGTSDGALKLRLIDRALASLYVEALKEKPGVPPRGAPKNQFYPPAPATIRKKLQCVASAFAYLHAEGILERNPFARVKPPKIDSRKRIPECLPFDAVSRLINAPLLEWGCYDRRKMSRAVVVAMIGAGLRRSEAVRLLISDLKQTQKGTYYLYLTSTKAGKDCEHVIPPWCAAILCDWRDRRLAAGAKIGEPLFCAFSHNRHTNRAISDSTAWGIFRREIEAIGLDPELGYSPHSARVTAISKLLADGKPHGDVKEFSRHASIEMVEYYDRRYVSKDKAIGLDLKFE